MVCKFMLMVYSLMITVYRLMLMVLMAYSLMIMVYRLMLMVLIQCMAYHCLRAPLELSMDPP